MIEALSVWVKTIVLVVLFASFMELLLPNSRIQTYIRVILGLFIMITILNPAIDLIHEKMLHPDIPAIRPMNVKNADEIRMQAERIDVQKRKLAQEVFCRDLGKQIAATVKSIEGVQEASVFVALEEQSQNLPVIKRVTVMIRLAGAARSVPKVDVNTTTNQTDSGVDRRVEYRIKNLISELYQIKASQIIIGYVK